MPATLSLWTGCHFKIVHPPALDRPVPTLCLHYMPRPPAPQASKLLQAQYTVLFFHVENCTRAPKKGRYFLL
ncbi:hypothetical protein Mapa_006914 [Marchantia paleacea]|nr:hypothetical protein Mapa_006914 [Marchantia paleacea]